MHCYYRKLTGESNIGVRHHLVCLGVVAFCVLSGTNQPCMAVASFAVPMVVFVCRGGLFTWRKKINLQPQSLSHYFPDCIG